MFAGLSIINICFIVSGILMLFIAWVDLRSFKVPDIPVAIIAVLGFYTRYLRQDDLLIAAGIAVVVGLFLFVLAKLFEMIRLKPVLGYGDVKLFIAAVLWLQIAQLPAFFVMTGVFGILIALIYLKKKYFPLAPAIAAAWVLTLL